MSDAPPVPAPPGQPQQIGRYRIVGRIGRGGMGVVYSAVDETMNRQVALKVLIADLETDPETRARFYREAQMNARLVHPNVISVYDAGEDQGRSYIAMPLLDGAPLPTYLKKPEAGSLERKLDLMIQVCEGLAAAHAAGIIHRDLKPNNLFVEANGLLKILDFGVARVTDSSMTAAGTMLGTPDYMSPEQARGASVDARSDIFSAGAVFYFMLAGRKPFSGPDLPAVFRQLQFEEPPPLRGVPPELSTLVLQAMAKKPDHRPALIQQLLADLARFRRQYRAGIHRLVVSLRAQLYELESLVAPLAETAAALAVAGAGADPLADIRGRLQFLKAPSSSMEYPDRAALNTAAEMLRAHRDQLSAVLEAQHSGLKRLEEGERALAAGDAVAALDIFTSVVDACEGSTHARNLAESARPLARKQQQRRELGAQLLGARQALPRDDLLAAHAQCENATDTEALCVRSTDEIRRARSAFRRGRQADALQQLEIFVSLEPDATSVLDELASLRALQSAMIERAAVADAHVRDRLARAGSALERGAFDDAVASLGEALRWDPTSHAASEMLDDVLVRQLETHLAIEHARMREQRHAAGAPIIAAARRAIEGGYVDVALQAALAAERIAPGAGGLATFIADAQNELASEDAELVVLDPQALPEVAPGETRSQRDGRNEYGAFARVANLFVDSLRRRHAES